LNYENLREIEKSIGEKIKHFRVLRGHPQTKIAEVLGISFQQLQKYESGVNRISPGKLFLLSRYLDVPITSFFELKNAKAAANDELVLNKDEAQILMIFKSLQSQKLKKKAIELCGLLNDLDDKL
jgi:transcriptional regulator with XRE-family HTH domain